MLKESHTWALSSESAESSQHFHAQISKIYLNIIIPCTPTPHKWSFHLKFTDKE
jgi:hypothetical protein